MFVTCMQLHAYTRIYTHIHAYTRIYTQRGLYLVVHVARKLTFSNVLAIASIEYACLHRSGELYSTVYAAVLISPLKTITVSIVLISLSHFICLIRFTTKNAVVIIIITIISIPRKSVELKLCTTSINSNTVISMKVKMLT